MKGYLRKRTERGGWQICIWTGTKPDGRPARYWETVRGSKADAQRRLRELLSSMDKGIPIPSGRLTVAEHLRNWIEGVKTSCSQRTVDGYQSVVENHLIPDMGHIQLKDLQPQTIQAFYGNARGKLSARTVLTWHRILSQSMKYAVRQGYLGRNPCDLVVAPRAVKKAMRTLTPGEVEVLLKAAEGSPHYPVIYMAINCGMRQAELLGLRWRDVDLDMLSVSVSQVLYKRRGVCIFKEPKTTGSRRSVAMTPKLAQFLREYRAERESVCWHQGRPLSLDDLVFAYPNGKPLDPCTLTHTFSRIARGAGLDRVRFHDLRHSFASLMLMRGAKPKVISEALGHASVAFTMDTYSHIISGMQEDAMALLDDVLPRGVVTASGQRQNLNSASSVPA
jgi:integrase